MPNGANTSYVVHAGRYKTRPNSVITVTGKRFEYASPEETPALMKDLVEWYNKAEAEGIMTPIELAALFHYRYIRIHPFEDGNGRISRLIVNYILHRHGYPMIVVKSADKDNYLKALNKCDVITGPIPSDGAHAELSQITPFVDYISNCLERALTISIKAAKGESIEEEDDWRKNLKLKYRDKMKMPEITLEIKEKILKEDFIGLLAHIDNELAEFYSLFTAVIWYPDSKTYHIRNDSDFWTQIAFDKNFGIITFGFVIHIEIVFMQFQDKISVLYTNNRNQELRLFEAAYFYSKHISEQDKNDVVNAIGQRLNLFIESRGLN